MDMMKRKKRKKPVHKRLKGALERYNKKRDEAMSSEIDLFKKYAGDNAELTSKWESLMMDSYYRTLVTQIDAEKRILMYKILAKYADDLSMNDIVKLAKIAVADSAENGSALESVFSLGEKAVDAIK